MFSICLKCSLSLFLLVLHIREVVVQPEMMIIRSCGDQRIVDHYKRNNHSYCYHACGRNLGEDNTVCSQDGDCLCVNPCVKNQTVSQITFSYDKEFCNPPSKVNDTADPNSQAHPQCISRCASQCPGGTGTICGESTDFDPEKKNGQVFTKICTCHCPVQRCPGYSEPSQLTTINNNNNNNAAVVIGATNSSQTAAMNNHIHTSVLVVPPPAQPNIIVALLDALAAFLKKLGWKLVLTKLFELGWLVVGVNGVWALQAIVVGIYSALFYLIIS